MLKSPYPTQIPVLQHAHITVNHHSKTGPYMHSTAEGTAPETHTAAQPAGEHCFWYLK